MQSDIRANEILRDIASGKTLSESGAGVGIKGTRARNLVSRLCRQLGLSDSLVDIRKNPELYLGKLPKQGNFSLRGLRSDLLKRLQKVLSFQSPEDFSPELFANLTATQLRSAGLTLEGIADVQCWLTQNAHSLRRLPPASDDELKAARRAIDLLDAFQFDVKVLREQFEFATT